MLWRSLLCASSESRPKSHLLAKAFWSLGDDVLTELGCKLLSRSKFVDFFENNNDSLFPYAAFSSV